MKNSSIGFKIMFGKKFIRNMNICAKVGEGMPMEYVIPFNYKNDSNSLMRLYDFYSDNLL